MAIDQKSEKFVIFLPLRSPTINGFSRVRNVNKINFGHSMTPRGQFVH